MTTEPRKTGVHHASPSRTWLRPYLPFIKLDIAEFHIFSWFAVIEQLSQDDLRLKLFFIKKILFNKLLIII
jgi:hypothetical protein